jgi:hypothetical protein
MREVTERMSNLHTACHRVQESAHASIRDVVASQREASERIAELGEEIRTSRRARESAARVA